MSSDKDMSVWFRALVDEITEAVEEAVDDTVAYGEDVMKEAIRNSGTGHGQWEPEWNEMEHGTPGRFESSPGRVAGGEMINAVSSASGRTSRTTYEGEIGWLGPAEDSWLSQEYGFRHNFTSALVDGMNALGQTFMAVEDELDRNMTEALRNV